jgi:protocatechuate 3,4-dioxygenase beta subunit
MNRRTYRNLIFPVIALGVLAAPAPTAARQTLLGGPCEGCEAVFEWGDRELTPTDTLPDFETAGQKLIVRGTIYEPDGETPAGGVILYIYHTNEDGEYAARDDATGWGRQHGFRRGWIRTDADGRYTFYTGMPGSYGGHPVHIHPTVLEPDGDYYYLNSYLFAGDPNLEGSHDDDRGGNGIVELKREDGVLVAERDIVLGLNVPGYEAQPAEERHE